jgi:copper(I)-binding protein
MKRSVWGAVALGVATLGLAACGAAEPQAEAEPAGPDGITVSNARLMLPAVKGNPGAVYLDVANSGSTNRVIRAASVAGASSTAMHAMAGDAMQEATQLVVPAGGAAKFEPGGTHIMAMNLADTVVAGGKADVTLTFVGGAKTTIAADVRAAGDER